MRLARHAATLLTATFFAAAALILWPGVPRMLIGQTTSGPVLWGSTSAPSTDNEFWWDGVNHRLGLGTSSPRYQLDIVDDGNYATRGLLQNAGTGTSAYANWVGSNGSGYAVFGAGGVNFTGVSGFDWSILKNAAYLLGDPGLNQTVIGNIGVKRTVFVIGDNPAGYGNLKEVGSINLQGGFDAGTVATELGRGVYNAQNGFAVNGTLGISPGTKSVGSCALTIQGGIITGTTC